MHILVCAATGKEIQSTVQQIAEKKFSGTIDVLITGVGLTATTYYLSKQVLSKRPQLMIQAGICGSISDKANNGDVVIIENESIGDQMVYEDGKWKSLFELGLCEGNKHPWTNCKLYNPYLDQFPVAGMKKVNSVSVNEITTNKEKIEHYKNNLQADVESLEGAALHYVAIMESIPFLQVRAVSNAIGERDKSKWLMESSIELLNKELEELLLKISN